MQSLHIPLLLLFAATGPESDSDQKEGSDWVVRTNPQTGLQDEIEVGVHQELSDEHSQDPRKVADFEAHLDRVEKHMWETYDDPELRPLLNRCKDRHSNCSERALLGHCQQHPFAMLEDCAPSCQFCPMLDYRRRCPYDNYADRALERPGDLNAMFERIAEESTDGGRFEDMDVTVWSKPIYTLDERVADTELFLEDAPWVISFDNFLAEDEVDRLVQLGGHMGYERSDDGGEYLADGTFVTYFIEGRTSYNTWLDLDLIQGDDDLVDVALRIEDVTQIPAKHYENFQMLRYSQTQHYHVHHDFDTYDVPRQPGPRVLTFFMYLSDVEEGGETNFPHLNLTFTPKKGRAVLWPNVLDEDTSQLDWRTEHQALPVVRGTKFAANAWIHQHDWQGPNRVMCAE